MATESIISLRGFAKFALSLMFISLCLSEGAGAQSVVATGPLSAAAPATASFGAIWNTAITQYGDLVVQDFKAGAMYDFPAGGGAMNTIIASGGMLNGWTEIGVGVNPATNDLLTGNNWAGCFLWDIPYNPATKTWDSTKAFQWGGAALTASPMGGWCHPGPISFNASGVAAIGNENSFDGIIEVPAAAPGTAEPAANSAVVIATGLKGRPRSLALDNAGNIYFFEDSGVPGVLRIAANQSGLTGEGSMTRVDPVVGGTALLSAIDGVTVDASGNVYISDSKLGVLLVPNENGTPNPADAVLMSAIPAISSVQFDVVRGIMYVPVNSSANGGWTAPNGVTYDDIVAVALSSVNLGSFAMGVQGAAQTINFAFDAAVTPASIQIVEPKTTTPDFAMTSTGSCAAGTAYAAGSTCTVDVALNSHTVGDVSAKLEMLDGSGNILASYSLSGIGLAPAVTSGPLSAIAPATTALQGVWNTAITQYGDLVVQDFKAGAMYDFPAGGGAMNTIIASGGMLNGWTEIGVGVNPATNDLLTGNNWAGCFLWDIPYNPATKTWDSTKAFQWGGAALTASPMGGWCHPGPISFNASGVAAIGNENSFDGIIEVPAAAPGTAEPAANSAVVIATGLKGRPRSLALDNAGNIYFFEDSGVPGVLRIAANQSGLTGEGSMTRVDPVVGGTALLSAIDGVTVDASGNVYISDSKLGVVLVPNVNGTLVTDGAYLFSAIPADVNVDFDVARGIMYVPTTSTANNGWVAPNGVTYKDFVAVALANVNLGSVASGSVGTTGAVNFGLGADVTPASFVIEEAGSTTPDFAVVSGGTCAAGTTYAAMSNCSVNVAMSPHSAGGVSGKLVMADARKNVLASITLFGTGQASAVSITPALEIPIGAGLNMPGEVAADDAGNTFVADAGLKEVLMYPAGATASTVGTSIGTGLNAPTGVAVNGAGDLFIADNGKVYEVPNTPNGLNPSAYQKLMSGLGTNLNLATDSMGSLYIADPDNKRVVKLSNAGMTFGAAVQMETDLTGFTAPSVVAVDANSNLYVVDSPNLIEVQPNGTRATLLTSLGGATGLAVDPSGAVYAAMSGGTMRIPFVAGALDTTAETAIAATVTNPTGLALDKAGNVYLADGTAKNLHMVSTSGILNLGSPALGVSSSLNADLLNVGNSPLTVTGFLSSDAVNFSATGCANPVAVAAACTATITMDPMGPGVQGPISSVITVQSNAAGAATVVDASGVAAALAVSKPTVSVGSGANVMSIPVTVSVASASGSGPSPTGNVILSVDGVVAQPSATLANGTVVITLSGLVAGPHTFSVQYIGDRVYGASSSSVSAVVAKATPLVNVPDLQQPAYVLFIGNQNGSYVPYDGSLRSYYMNYVVTVAGATGLIPTGTVSFVQGSTAQCGPNGEPTNAYPTGSFTLDAKGTATFQPGCLAINANTVIPDEVTPQTITSIVYSGDANYAPITLTTTANGSPIKFVEIRQPSVLITPNPGAVTVAAATYPATASASTTLTITSLLGFGVSTNPAFPSATPTAQLNNYTLPVAFNCVGLPAHATCTFSGGNYVDINGVQHPDEVLVDTDPSKPSTITVTVTTNAPVGTTTSQLSPTTPLEFAAIFGLGMIGLTFSRKSLHKKGFMVLVCFLALCTAGAGLTACNTVQLGSQAILGTPTQTAPYAVSVTAQQVGSIVVPGSKGAPIDLYGSTNLMSLPYTLNVTVQ
jgi:sugar lactone lactonase YvrE